MVDEKEVLLSESERSAVKMQAALVNSISEEYQLIHAMYACECLIQANVKKAYESMSKELAEKIISCSENKLDELKEEKRTLEEVIRGKRLSITVEYVNMATDEARAVKVDNTFTIVLPVDLKEKIKDSNGKRDYDTISAIRKMMAHELGHLILHTDALCRDKGTVGTLKIKDKDEEEAILFAKELLELRRQRNGEILRDGGAHTLM